MRAETKHLVILTLAAAVFRLLHCFVYWDDVVVGGDQIQNVLLAKNFAAGNFYAVLDAYWTPLYPILIGSLTYFIDDLVIPSLIISIIAGSLAAPLTYLLARESFDETVAVLSGAIAVFFPHLINSVFDLGTENLYLVFVTAVVIIGWRALQRRSLGMMFSVGLLIGLSYLTRPEGFTILFLLVAYSIVADLLREKRLASISLTRIGALILGFAILAAPYVVYLRAETGRWTMSGKIGVNFAGGEMNVEDPNEPEEDPVPPVRAVAEAFVSNLVNIQVSFSVILPLLVFGLVSLGLFGSAWTPERWLRESFLISFCIFVILVYAVSVSQTRYYYVLLPIFFGWTAKGMVRLGDWLDDSVKDILPKRLDFIRNRTLFYFITILALYGYLLPVNNFMRSTDYQWQTNAFEERDAGLWIKNNGKKAATIFSASRRPVFYAEGKQVYPESYELDEVFKRIKSDKEIGYVVWGERSNSRNRFLEGLDELLEDDSEFRLAYTRFDVPEFGIKVYVRVR